MPRISFFYGIGVWMYWNEGVHAWPHFHVRFAGHAASVGFGGELIAGSLPPRVLSLVATWAAVHRDELYVNWQLARQEEPMNPIDPLP